MLSVCFVAGRGLEFNICARRIGARGLAQVTRPSSRMGWDFVIFPNRLYHWILRLQTLGVIAAGMKHIQFHMRHVWCAVWHNTCVTGDSMDRNLATAIGRADS